MNSRRFVAAAIVALMVGAPTGFGKDIVLRRTLPPAVPLEANSFTITASSQERDGDFIAASFRELFKAKVQGLKNFTYTDINPSLRVSIVVTRFYVEPKTFTGSKPCSTFIGNLQGTFSVVDSETGRPLASDTLGWKLQTTETQHVLLSEDGEQVPVSSPRDKLQPNQFWNKVKVPVVPVGETLSAASSPTSVTKAVTSRVPFGLGGGGKKDEKHPCDTPFTKNETQDMLADAFLTDMVHLALPYTEEVTASISSDKVFREAAEDIQAKRWSKALDGLLKLPVQAKPDDEAERLNLVAITYEGLGYGQGEQAFELIKKSERSLPADDAALRRKELLRVVSLAKDYFDKASFSFQKANEKKDRKEYRDGERRADESRSLYVRIQKYTELGDKPAVKPVQAKLSMSEIVGMCAQRLAGIIIVDRIETATELGASREESGELSKCGDMQTEIFTALKKRWDSKK